MLHRLTSAASIPPSVNQRKIIVLQSFGHELWIHDGSEIMGAAGFHYPTRMAVIRLSRGGLWIWSPTALSDELGRAVDALGPVQALIAPNTLHHTFMGEWSAAYPEAQIYLLPELAGKRLDLNVAEALSDRPAALWAGDIEQVVFTGNALLTECVFFHHASGTALFTDLLQNLPVDWYRGWRKLVARLDLMTEQIPTVPRKFRIAFRDRALARAALDRVESWPVERVLMAHGAPISSGGRDFLSHAFRWLQ